MRRFASWRHGPYVAHAQSVQTWAAVEFPACFPAMAEVKARLFYGGKSRFPSLFNETPDSARHHDTFWTRVYRPRCWPRRWRRVSRGGGGEPELVMLQPGRQRLCPPLDPARLICFSGSSSCGGSPGFSCARLRWRPRRHVSDAERIIVCDADSNWLLFLPHLHRFSLMCV